MSALSYREALALGLDRGDTIVKRNRRLICAKQPDLALGAVESLIGRCFQNFVLGCVSGIRIAGCGRCRLDSGSCALLVVDQT